MIYDWIYLCNEPSFLRLMLAKMPRQRFKGLGKFVVVTNERNVELIPELHATIQESGHPNTFPYDVVHDGAMIDETVRVLNLSPEAKIAFSLYPLSVKLCIPWWFTRATEWILYTDDDVLVLRDPIDLTRPKPLWGNMNGIGSRFRAGNWKHDLQVEALNEIFDLTFDIAHYNRHRMNGGTWTFQRDDEYLKYLRRFWEHPFYRTAHINLAKTEHWLLDQRFLTGYWNLRDGHFLQSQRKYRLFRSKFPKALEKDELRWPLPTLPYFVHYMAWKSHYVKWFTENIPDA